MSRRQVKIVSMRAAYKSATVDEFIDRHATEISRRGIFLKAARPFPVGTRLRFEIQIAGHLTVLSGLGRVVTIREHDRANGLRPAGMWVRFLEIDDLSKDVIDAVQKARPDAGLAYDEGADAGSMFSEEQQESEEPESDEQRPEQPTLITPMEAVIKEHLEAEGHATEPTPEPPAAVPTVNPPVDETPAAHAAPPESPRAPRAAALEAIRPELSEVRMPAAPSSIPVLSPLPSARPSPQRPVLRSLRAPLRSVRRKKIAVASAAAAVGALAALALTLHWHRRPQSDLSRGLETPAAASATLPTAAKQVLSVSPSMPPSAIPMPTPSFTAEQAAADLSPPAVVNASAGGSPKPVIGAPAATHVVHRKPEGPTKTDALPKPGWLLRPSKVDNPY
jgi:hypothetical protein